MMFKGVTCKLDASPCARCEALENNQDLHRKIHQLQVTLLDSAAMSEQRFTGPELDDLKAEMAKLRSENSSLKKVCASREPRCWLACGNAQVNRRLKGLLEGSEPEPSRCLGRLTQTRRMLRRGACLQNARQPEALVQLAATAPPPGEWPRFPRSPANVLLGCTTCLAREGGFGRGRLGSLY